LAFSFDPAVICTQTKMRIIEATWVGRMKGGGDPEGAFHDGQDESPAQAGRPSQIPCRPYHLSQGATDADSSENICLPVLAWTEHEAEFSGI
jgi:hypothetical protein